MRIQTKGTTGLSKVNGMIKEIVTGILEKAELDTKTPFKIQDFTCDIVFDIEGKEQKMTVNHDGLDEVFTVAIKLDKKGNIDYSVDNTEKSFIDDYVRSEMTGQEIKYERIESMYNDTDLEYLESNEIGDIQEKIYKLKDSSNNVVRYYKCKDLVGEVELKNKK
ncbi:hypothetical protein [Romboutsia ilealis]|uniref:hypothetical protein n=1 Tax=Romboutsia ilealis TaxID=1115758 RepID=UPI0026F3B136|nr:hypothetical protein [Romboutsia ilealis]